ncbi:hypothetical protein AB6A40_006692 [Gnathostoma spinigerum]|uniref:DNA methyltransferase 1-associated protein 1 n=1 Tax=Gnathostoma spinigerum TaxID=75299 RepID=A0ABD6EJB2_9BILA
MNTSDAQDILGPQWTGGSNKDSGLLIGGLVDIEKNKKRSSRSDAHFKKPEGMHRELYNLLSQDREKNLAALIPTASKNSGYRNQKARIGLRHARPWEWRPFVNEARTDGLRLSHWQRVDKLDTAHPYPFARFNKVINIPVYTNEEYDKYLTSNKWTKEDTAYLFELCRRFDLRWVVIADRWEGSVKKTMEEMKDRFYNVVNEINSARETETEPLCYDAEHEKRRKEQLIKLWDRTEEQVEEEEMLLAELKRIEVRKRERERKAQDLQKLITATERAPVSPASTSNTLSPAAGSLKRKACHRNKASTSALSHSSSGILPTEHSTLRFPEFRSAGAHLRSQEMKLPTNIGQKKLKNIETVIDRLKLDPMPVGAEEIVLSYNEFRASVILLQELKHALQTAEYELESLRTRYTTATGETFEIEPRMRVSGSVMDSTDNDNARSLGMPTSSRVITEMLEISTSLPQAVRRRKATTPQIPAGVEVKRTRRS